jgi:hypothetical protein
MKYKVLGIKLLWPNLRYYPGSYLEELRNTTENISQDSRSPGWEENLMGQTTWTLRFRWEYDIVVKLCIYRGKGDRLEGINMIKEWEERR